MPPTARAARSPNNCGAGRVLAVFRARRDTNDSPHARTKRASRGIHINRNDAAILIIVILIGIRFYRRPERARPQSKGAGEKR